MNEAEKRDDYVVVELTCQLGMNNLIWRSTTAASTKRLKKNDPYLICRRLSLIGKTWLSRGRQRS